MRSVSTVRVLRRGPFQTLLTLNSTLTGSFDLTSGGSSPWTVTEVTRPANTASASANASLGEPEEAHEQAWAGLGVVNNVRHNTATTATVPATTRLTHRVFNDTTQGARTPADDGFGGPLLGKEPTVDHEFAARHKGGLV